AQARRRPAPPPGASRGEVHGWHHAGAARSRRAEGRRLINPRSTTFDNSSTALARESRPRVWRRSNHFYGPTRAPQARGKRLFRTGRGASLCLSEALRKRSGAPLPNRKSALPVGLKGASVSMV